MSKKILFLTTHNLATNPRLVKEIRLALHHRFSVEVICFEFDNWSRKFNEKLKAEFREVKMICIPAGRKPFLPWIGSVASEWYHRKVVNTDSERNAISRAISRRSNQLIKALSIVSKPDLVIGHNAAALYPTLYAAKMFNCKAGFDMEDYHPGEGLDNHLQNLSLMLIQQVLPEMDYVSFAAPMIKKQVKTDLKGLEGKWITLLNYFPSSEFAEPLILNGRIRMVWFSQNIDEGRGLEWILPTIKKLSTKIELHLFGHLNKEFNERELKSIPNIFVHEPLPQVVLHKKLKEFDIGLALESESDFNRELCLTNKILAYMQAGLYILASDTLAQKDYLNSYPEHGAICNLKEISRGVNFIVEIISEIRQKRSERFKMAEALNWENESRKLLETWNCLIN